MKQFARARRIAVGAVGLLIGALIGPVIPVVDATSLGIAQAAWTRVELNGVSVCKDAVSGTTFKPPYSAKADVTKACNTLTSFLPWLGTAEAQAAFATIPGVVKAPPSQPGSPNPTLHSPWAQCDVGSPPAAGSATNGAGIMTLTGTGDLGSNNNNNVMIGHFVYQPWSGPFDMVTQVQSLTGSFDWRQAGLFAGWASCANTAPWVAVSTTVETSSTQQGVGFHLDGTVNGRSTKYSTSTSGPLPPPQWIRLSFDNTIASTYYGSSQTGPWTLVDSEARALTGTFVIGTFCTSASTVSTELATCTFSEPIITVPSGNAGTLSFSTATQTVVEDAGSVQVCLTRNGGSAFSVGVTASVTGGTATGSDYTAGTFPTTYGWAANNADPNCTTVPITNRAGTQGSRTIILSLGSYTGGATAGSITSQTITIQDAQTFAGQKKWHPGYYIISPRQNTYKFNQSARFSNYDGQGSASFRGWQYMTTWSQLEGATHGDYTAGDAMLVAEVAHLKSEAVPKRLILQIDDEMYGGSFTWYPTYLVNAGCVYQELWSDGIHYLYHFKWWDATCVGYYNNLMTHLGALLDTEPYFEALIMDYEQAISGNDIHLVDRTGFMNGVNSAMQAAANAFPHTNLAWRANWGITFHEADLVQVLGYAKSLGIGWGSQDACSRLPDSPYTNVYGTYPIYQDAQNIFAGYGGYDSGHHAGTYTDQRGKMFSADGVEDSELGYNSVCNGQGFAGYAPVGSAAQIAGYMSLYDEWNAEWNTHPIVEYNTWVGANVQRWSVGTTGSLWDLVTNHPLTHTACPTDYDSKFGNGTAGSGCNTN